MKVSSFSRRKPESKKKIKNVKYLYGDVSKKRDFKKLEKNFKYVVNLSGNIDHNDKKEVYKSHFIGVKNIASFCISNKVDHLIQLGSSGEYGNSKSPHTENSKCLAKTHYNKTKLMASKYLLKKYSKSALKLTILRPYQIYGPYQSINRVVPITIINCLNNRTFNCSAGTQYRDFLFINDMVNAIFLTLGNKKAFGEIINLGSGKIIKIKNLILNIKNAIKGGHPLFGIIPLRKDEKLKIYTSIQKAKKILKWSPKVPITVGLKKTIKNYKVNNSNYTYL